jgi:hypothetical protein
LDSESVKLNASRVGVSLQVVGTPQEHDDRNGDGHRYRRNSTDGIAINAAHTHHDHGDRSQGL